MVVWGLIHGDGFHREKWRGGSLRREASERFSSCAQGMEIMKDLFGPEVVRECMALARGGSFEWEHACGRVHSIS